MKLMRWEPELELQELADRMNRLLHGQFSWSGDSAWTLGVDVTKDENEVTVKASVPGVKAEDLDVSIENDTLVIKGQTATDTEEKKEGWVLRERRSGSFYRSLSLPESVDEAKATVTLKDGELTITAPIAKTEKRKKLTVNTAA